MTKSDAARAEVERAAELEALDAADAKDKVQHAHKATEGPQGECAACGKICRLSVDGRVHAHRRELGELGGYKSPNVNCVGSRKPPQGKEGV